MGRTQGSDSGPQTQTFIGARASEAEKLFRGLVKDEEPTDRDAVFGAVGWSRQGVGAAALDAGSADQAVMPTPSA